MSLQTGGEGPPVRHGKVHSLKSPIRATSIFRVTAPLFALIATIPLAWAAQEAHTFRSSDGKLSLVFTKFVLSVTPTGDNRIVMTGGVDASSLTQGLRIKSDKADAVIQKVGDRSTFKSVKADGHVVLVKTARNRSTTLQCATANFLAGPTENVVNGAGHVRIVDADQGKHQLLVATGSRCLAKLASQDHPGTDPLKSATLEGPVTVQIDQAPEKPNAKPGTVTATSDRLEYANGGSTATLTLLGHVHMTGRTGLFNGISGPMPILKIDLNDKRQMLGASGGSIQ